MARGKMPTKSLIDMPPEAATPRVRLGEPFDETGRVQRRDRIVAEYPLLVTISTWLFQPFTLWLFVFFGFWRIWWMWGIFLGSFWTSGVLPLTSPRRFTIEGERLSVVWLFGREQSFSLSEVQFTARSGVLSILTDSETLEMSNGRRFLIWPFLTNKRELWSALGVARGAA